MPIKETGQATNPELREWDGGFSWIAHPEEGMQRTGHALFSEDGVWLVDPLDFEGLDGRLDDREVAGVALLLERHKRDAAGIARRHDASVHLPSWMGGVERDLDAPVSQFENRLGDTDYEAREIDTPVWTECALWDGETLVVPEAVGANEFSRARGERLGVQPVLRLFPPRRALGGLEPERILTGHGMGVFEDASATLADALAGSRKRAPGLYLKTVGEFLPG